MWPSGHAVKDHLSSYIFYTIYDIVKVHFHGHWIIKNMEHFNISSVDTLAPMPHRSTMDINNSHHKQTDAILLEREIFFGSAARYEHYRIIKNVLLIGIAFMLHFTAFHGTANLQSSINAEGALGSYTLAAIYGSLILSNIFLPAMVIR